MHLSCRNGSGLAQQVGEPGADLTVDLRVCDRQVERIGPVLGQHGTGRPDLLHGLRIKGLIPPPGKAVHQDVILPAQQELKCFCVVPSKIAPVPLPDMVSVPIVRVSFGGCQPVLCRFSHTEMQEVPAESAGTSGLLVSPPEYAIMEAANLLTPFSRADQWEVFCR